MTRKDKRPAFRSIVPVASSFLPFHLASSCDKGKCCFCYSCSWKINNLKERSSEEGRFSVNYSTLQLKTTVPLFSWQNNNIGSVIFWKDHSIHHPPPFNMIHNWMTGSVSHCIAKADISVHQDYRVSVTTPSIPESSSNNESTEDQLLAKRRGCTSALTSALPAWAQWHKGNVCKSMSCPFRNALGMRSGRFLHSTSVCPRLPMNVESKPD